MGLGLQRVEQRLERLVEGTFARVFRSELRPVELGRRLTRELDIRVTLGVRGEQVAPNHAQFHLNKADYERFLPFSDTLAYDLAEAIEAHAADQNYQLKGPGIVELIVDAKQKPGQFRITTAIAVAPSRGRPSAWIVLPDNSSVAVIDGDPLVIGRMPDCDITLADTNVSRRHTEIRMFDGKATVVDLGSLNGTKVNGRGVAADQFGVPVRDGDVISVGPVTLTFTTKRPSARG
jgi:hypothetical protein